jgi:hypothetical protein
VRTRGAAAAAAATTVAAAACTAYMVKRPVPLGPNVKESLMAYSSTVPWVVDT